MARPDPRGVLRSPWSWVPVALWGLLLTHALQGRPRDVPPLIVAVTGAAALTCWLRVLTVRSGRWPWALLSLGLTGYSGGFAVLFWVSSGEGAGPFGLNLSDCSSLLLYPCGYAALVLLTRERSPRWSRTSLLDGLVVGLAAWAVALAWVAGAAPALLRGPVLDVVYALAYPVGGATLLALGLVGLVVARARPDRVWLLLLLGFAFWTVGDGAYGARSAAGTFRFGTALDAVYVAGPVLVALAAWSAPTARTPAEKDSAAVMSVPVVAALAALAVLVDRDPDLPVVAVQLAALVVLASVARTALFVRRERLLAQRTREARTDDLTGLPNRRSLLGDLDAHRLAAGPGALVRLELDHVDKVQEVLGHQAGDRVLRELAGRVVLSLPGAVVARVSGSGFAVLLPGPVPSGPAPGAVLPGPVLPEQVPPGQEPPGPEHDAVRAVQGLVRELEVPVGLDGCGIAVSAVAGLCAWDAGCCPGPDEALRRADVALLAARVRGGGPAVWRPLFDERARERLGLVADLLTALAAPDQLLVHLQPQSSPLTREVTGAEALVRWAHPSRGMVPPDGFVGPAESAGLLCALTDRVLDLALDAAARLRDARRPLPVAVNLGAADLLDPDLPGRVQSALERHGVPVGLLRLEVTESVVMSDPQRIVHTLRALRALGVGLSLDDYGTGLSSLSYLRELPVDELKIDRSFVQRMADDAASALIVCSTIALAHGLGMTVVAEGVEDEATLAALVDAGCDVVQGYLLGRPAPAEQLLPAATVPGPRDGEAALTPVS